MDKEQWSWSKFFKGFFDGKNYAKAIVMMVCMIIIIVIISSVYQQIKSRFFKEPAPSHKVEEVIEANTGTITKTDSHDTTSNKKDSWNFLGLHLDFLS